MWVKVCGNTAIDTAMVAVDAGADALGFIMAPDTPRTLSPGRAREIVSRMPPTVELVGVFVDRPAAEVAEIAAEVGFTALQLDGRETWSEFGPLERPLIKGVRLKSASSAATVDWPPGLALHIDSHSDVLPGGTGKTFPWAWAADLVLRYRVLLSGGLHAENVGEAMRAVRPWGVDASSRLESSPGVKDPERVRAYVAAARRAEAKLVANV